MSTIKVEVTVTLAPESVRLIVDAVREAMIGAGGAPAPAPAPASRGPAPRVVPKRTTLRPAAQPIEADRWYDLSDVAIHYSLAKTTARELVADGFLPGEKVGRGWRIYGADILAKDEQMRADSQLREIGPPVKMGNRP